MNKRWRNVGLYVLLVVVVIVVGTAFLDRPDPTTAARTLRYSDFVESVQEDQVSRVLLSPDRGTAQIVETDGRRAEVNLAPDKDLLKMLTDHNVDSAVQPSRQPGAWQQAATSLIFPLLLPLLLCFSLDACTRNTCPECTCPRQIACNLADAKKYNPYLLCMRLSSRKYKP